MKGIMTTYPKSTELKNNLAVIEINKYPYPIAHAWRLAHDERYGATVRHINVIGCFYQCLRW